MSNIGLFSEIAEELGSLLVFYFVLCGFSSVIGIALYLLNGFGLFNMSKSLGLNKPWLSFIPFANIFAFGRVAQHYVKRDGTKSAKFGPILLTLYLIQFLILVVFTVFTVIALISLISNASAAINQDVSMELSMFQVFIPVIIFYFLLFAVAVTYSIIYYVSMWRIFSVFCNENSTLFTVLSILFSFLGPVFIFVCRNREPKLTYAERMNFQQASFEISEEN